ncbi:hypothetical protein K501DRAFT_286244 [Backusella circina FSU 941]|nr:hypothetical protein K501DRAFT_286244 [Backusella circina FSU 941]
MTKATPARWVPADELDDKKKRSSWTEVISTKKKHDPFAGMKSCVDYEQEIERIKQLVPKVDHRKRTSKTTSSSSSTISDASSTCSATSLHNINNINNNPSSNNNINHNNNTPKTPTRVPSLYSRSSSPCSDNHDSSDDAESVPEQTSVITEEEKARFLAFVRSWTGDWKGGWNSASTVELNSGSLWTEQSPWDTAPQYRSHHMNNHPLVIAMPTATTTAVSQPIEHINTNELYWQWKRPSSHYSMKYPQPIQRPIRPF